MESEDLHSCLWLVLVKVPLPSANVCRATRQSELPPVTTAVLRVDRGAGVLHVTRGFDYRVDTVPHMNAVRIAWTTDGERRTSRVNIVAVRKPIVWLENGETTVMACAFVNEEAALGWAACRHLCLIPPSQSLRAA